MIPDVAPHAHQSQSTPKRAGGYVRWLKRAFLYAAVMVLVLSIGILFGWQAIEQHLLERTCADLPQLTHGVATCHDAGGQLPGILTLGEIDIQLPQQRISLRNISLRPHLSWLLADRLSAKFMTIEDVDIHQLVTSDHPLHLPSRIPLPFAIDVDTLTLGHLRYHSQKNDLHFAQGVFHRVRLSDLLWQSDEFQFQTQQFSIQGHGHIIPEQPYYVAGHYSVQGLYRQHALNLTMDGQGRLGELIETQGHGQLGAANITVSAGIFVTHAQIFPHIDVTANTLTLRDWQPRAPDVLLQGELHAKADALGFHGTVSATNSRTGIPKQQRIPIRQLQSDWQWIGGTTPKLSLQDAHLQQSDGAHIDGDLFWNGGIRLTARASAINLTTWSPTLQATHLFGPFSVQTDNYRDYTVNAALIEGHDRLAVQGTVNAQGAHATHLEFSRGESHITGSASLDFAGSRAMEAAMELRNANPALFAHLPPGRLNGHIHVKGTLRPQLDIDIDTTLANSQWLNSNLSLNARGHFTQPELIHIDAMQFTLGQLSGTANGSLGSNTDHMTISAAFAGEQAWLPELKSHAQIDGQLQGPWRHPIFTGHIAADDLSYHDLAVRGLQLTINSTAALNDWLASNAAHTTQLPPLTANGNVKIIAYQGREMDNLQLGYTTHGEGKNSIALSCGALTGGPVPIKHLSLGFEGSLTEQVITLAMDQANEHIHAQLHGNLDLNAPAWHGTLMQFNASGTLPLSIDDAVAIAWTPDSLNIGAARLHAGLMEADLTDTHIDHDHWTSSGHLAHFDIRQLLTLLGKPAPETTLAMGADWSLDFNHTLNGHIKITREGGQWINDEALDALRLQGGQLSLDIKDNQLSGDLHIRSRSAGDVEGKVATTLSIVNGRPGILGSTPIKASLNLDAPSLAWLGLWLALPGYQINGQASGHLELSGSIANPHLQGALQGRNISFSSSASGIKWHDGSVDAHIENNQLVVSQVSWAGESGQVSGQGHLSLSENAPDIYVELNADKLQVFGRHDQTLIISGKGRASLQNQRLALDADLQVDRGLITLRNSATATLDDDIKLPARQRTKPEEGKRIGLYINAKLNLGDNFHVKSRGFDAQGTGQLLLNATPQQTPALTGSVLISRGSLTAYGQNLKVRADTSSLNFVGPFDNPGLNIYAYKYNENQPTDPKTGNRLDVGVHILGNAQRPVVNLVSDPVGLSDSQKLSWLLFGEDISAQSTTRQNSVLAAAATALASGIGNGEGQSLPQMIGIDQVSVEHPTDTTDLSQGLVRLSKQLAPNLYLSFGKGYNGAADDVLINYIINKKWSIELRGSRNSSADLFYTIPFD